MAKIPKYKLLLVNKDQAGLLKDVIDMHVEGVVASKELTTLDPTVESAEQLLDLASGYDDDLRELAIIRRRLE